MEFLKTGAVLNYLMHKLITSSTITRGAGKTSTVWVVTNVWIDSNIDKWM